MTKYAYINQTSDGQSVAYAESPNLPDTALINGVVDFISNGKQMTMCFYLFRKYLREVYFLTNT